MHRAATYCFALLALFPIVESAAWCAVNWKLILKDGSVIECDGVPLIVDDVYTFRQMDGTAVSVPADRIDQQKTDQANKVERRQWRELGGRAKEQEPAKVVANPSSHVLTLRDADFDAQVLKSHTPVMVEFWATWCGYCRRFEPTVQAIASEYAGQINVGKLDVDQNPATAKRYGIHGTPTVLLFKDGNVVGAIDGAADKAVVVRMLTSGL